MLVLEEAIIATGKSLENGWKHTQKHKRKRNERNENERIENFKLHA